jgi:xanthine dehydrogenase accessory factor
MFLGPANPVFLNLMLTIRTHGKWGYHGGKITIHLAPVRQELICHLNRELAARHKALIVTDLTTEDSWLFREKDVNDHTARPIAHQSTRTDVIKTMQHGRLFFNVYAPCPRLYVIGAVHISQVLTPIAHYAGYDVEIIDPGAAFATEERFPKCKLHTNWPEDVFQKSPLDKYSALIALSHDPKIDDWAAEKALASKCFYVGALGSIRTHEKRLERLRLRGLTNETLGRIHAPIRLDIKAATPAEIAVTILAEVIQHYRNGV